MSSSFRALAPNSTKEQEIAHLQSFVQSLPSDNAYLSMVFTPDLVRHIEDAIRGDGMSRGVPLDIFEALSEANRILRILREERATLQAQSAKHAESANAYYERAVQAERALAELRGELEAERHSNGLANGTASRSLFELQERIAAYEERLEHQDAMIASLVEENGRLEEVLARKRDEEALRGRLDKVEREIETVKARLFDARI